MNSLPEDSQIGLPDLHQATIDEPMVRSLFRDIGALTTVVDIIPKLGARVMAAESFSPLDLDGALSALLDRNFHGVQIRYDFGGLQWWDSVLRLPAAGRYRLVRISHDIAKIG